MVRSPRHWSRPKRRFAAIGAAAMVAVIAFVLIYFEPQAAFIDDTVNETIPGLEQVIVTTTTSPADTTGSTVEAPVAASTPQTSADTTADASADTGQTATTSPAGTVPTTTPLPSTTPLPANSVSGALAAASSSGQPVVLSTATFFSGEHDTDGTALVVALPDGSLVVRFEDLDTSNGPDLRVVLSPDEASESWEYSGRTHLGELKGNIGDQNYDVPADVDITGYQSVVIWCERFSVAFGAAAIDVTA